MPMVVEPGAPVGWSAGYVIARIVTILFGILQLFLILRIVLLILGADQANTIVADVMSWTNPFITPFSGIFNLSKITLGANSVLDIPAVVALIAWTIIESIIVAVLRLVP